jgi:nicotinamide phosphoribosyltransferase
LTEDQLNFLAALETHDFGDRAGSCAEESEVLGMAQMTSHFGTDTVAGAYLAWLASNKTPWGCSIHALAHRIVQGFEKEEDAYLSLYNAKPHTFTSHVADCYNFYNAIDSYLVPLAKKALETGGVIVARPDSGDPFEQIVYALDAAKDAGLAKKSPNGLWEMTSLRVIQGDGMTFSSIRDINEKLINRGYSPPGCLIYGVGGYLRNALNRDNFGATMKLCAVGEKRRPVMKFSHTPGKGSVPGLVKICREKLSSGETAPTVRTQNEEGNDQYVLYYDGIYGKGIIYEEDFREVRKRVLNEFHSYAVPTDPFSSKIKDMKKALHSRYVYRAEEPITSVK